VSDKPKSVRNANHCVQVFVLTGSRSNHYFYLLGLCSKIWVKYGSLRINKLWVSF